MTTKLALAFFMVTATAALADNYPGNGGTGFGGTLGNGSLSITQAGNAVNFSFTPSGTYTSNDVVLYLDTAAGGFGDTSSFSDNADGGRTAISGVSGNGRTLATFAAGFGADLAISLEPGFAGLFGLASGGNNSLNFLADGGLSGSGSGPFNFSFTLAQLGLNPGDSFKFVGTLISTTAFRSDESIGTISPTGANPGFTGSITFSNSNTFATVPEPATVLLIGPALLGGMFFIRRRRS